MAILVTMIDSYRNYSGTIGIDHFEYNSSYSFTKCLKIKYSIIKGKGVIQWLHYFGKNDRNAVLSTIKIEELCTGHLKVHILDSKIVNVSSVGEFNSGSTHNYYLGYMVHGEVLNKSSVLKRYLDDINGNGNGLLQPVVVPVQEQKVQVEAEVVKPKSLYAMTAEDILKYKNIIAKNKKI